MKCTTAYKYNTPHFSIYTMAIENKTKFPYSVFT